MWVRGLKHILGFLFTDGFDVAPYVGAWIETIIIFFVFYIFESHPMWVRGLKPASLVYRCR